MAIQQNTSSEDEEWEVVKNQPIAQMLSYGTPSVTIVLKNELWHVPPIMCCDVL